MPIIKRRFIMFPTPKNLKSAKRVMAVAVITPLLRFVNRTEKVKRVARNSNRKKRGRMPKFAGSVK